MEVEDWAGSSGEASDTEAYLQDGKDEELHYTSGVISKLQFRKDISKAQWKNEMIMAEVVEKKGRMWTTTGIIRDGKTYCFIEEILFMAEIGALVLMDDYNTPLSLREIYEKAADRNGCSWEFIEAYKHLKSLGYIVKRHGIPWTKKSVKNNSVSLQSHTESDTKIGREPEDEYPLIKGVNDLQISEVRPILDVYLPNSKFRKSSPGDPNFVLCFTGEYPPSKAENEALKRRCGGIALKFCHVEHGRVGFFSFDRVELPVLP